MTIEQAVADHLAADGSVAGVVGTRVFTERLPQSPMYPAVLVQLIDDPTTSHLRGVVNLYRARVQVDAYDHEESGGDPYATVGDLSELIDASLLGLPTVSFGSPQVLKVVFVERQSRIPIYEPEELRLHRMMQDYTVIYRRS